VRRQSEAATALWIKTQSKAVSRFACHRTPNKSMTPQQSTLASDNLSREYFERALRVSPGGVHSPVRAFKGVGGTPIFFRSAQGGTMTSVDGLEYIDFCQSFGPLMLGHRDPEIAAAVEEAIATAWSFGACEPYSLELAEWITSRLPWVEMLRFVSSGTEAVMSAFACGPRRDWTQPDS